jgi:hypothetical protein
MLSRDVRFQCFRVKGRTPGEFGEIQLRLDDIPYQTHLGDMVIHDEVIGVPAGIYAAARGARRQHPGVQVLHYLTDADDGHDEIREGLNIVLQRAFMVGQLYGERLARDQAAAEIRRKKSKRKQKKK